MVKLVCERVTTRKQAKARAVSTTFVMSASTLFFSCVLRLLQLTSFRMWSIVKEILKNLIEVLPINEALPNGVSDPYYL